MRDFAEDIDFRLSAVPADRRASMRPRTVQQSDQHPPTYGTLTNIQPSIVQSSVSQPASQPTPHRKGQGYSASRVTVTVPKQNEFALTGSHWFERAQWFGQIRRSSALLSMHAAQEVMRERERCVVDHSHFELSGHGVGRLEFHLESTEGSWCSSAFKSISWKLPVRNMWLDVDGGMVTAGLRQEDR